MFFCHLTITLPFHTFAKYLEKLQFFFTQMHPFRYKAVSYIIKGILRSKLENPFAPFCVSSVYIIPIEETSNSSG